MDSIGDTWAKGLFLSTINEPNTTQRWVPTDSEQNYKIAVEKSKKFNNEYPWTPDSITYEFNAYGFRCEEFAPTDKFKILVCGCSFTEGIGLPLDAVWPALLSEKIPNSVVYNLAQGGHSSAYVARAVHKTIDILSPDLVAVLWPPLGRFEHFAYDYDTTLTPAGPFQLEYPQFLTNLKNQKYNQEMCEVLLSNTCKIANVPLITCHSICTEISSQWETLIDDYKAYSSVFDYKFASPHKMADAVARDGMHPGKLWQRNAAKLFYEKFLQLS